MASRAGSSGERVLSTRELNRALLARQCLLEPSGESIPRVLERAGGLQMQYAPSGYIGLWSRMRGFEREDLTRALERRRAVQATLMRATIHLVSARDLPLFAAGIRRVRREWWLRFHGDRLRGVDMDALADRVRAHLSGGPLRQGELAKRLTADGFPSLAQSGVGMWVDLVRVPPSGTWEQRRADLYGLANGWLRPSSPSEAEGLEHLVRRYLGGFGPATLTDLASWAGLSVTTLRPVIDRLRLRRFRDEVGTELLDLGRAPVPDSDTAAPPRFLPTWDATLLVHARRTQILPERYRARVFNTKTPHSMPTFLVDGCVAGTWRYAGGRVRVEPFHPLPPATRREVKDQAKRLADLHAP